ncbi:MAG: T9SS type A sorting domain-containing protein [bacterium]
MPILSFVTLKVFDITGKEIQTLVDESKNAGSYQVTFNGVNLSSGIYYVKMQSGNISWIRKMMLIK